MKEFYLVIKAKVEAGQYKLEEMLSDLQLAYEKDRITLEQHEELVELAKVRVDMDYEGNKYATAYDLDQDLEISQVVLTSVENFELIMTFHAEAMDLNPNVLNIMSRSAIGDSYVMVIVKGLRKFSSVHPSKRQEVADKLIAMGRQDLIDLPEYLPVDPDFSVE